MSKVVLKASVKSGGRTSWLPQRAPRKPVALRRATAPAPQTSYGKMKYFASTTLLNGLQMPDDRRGAQALAHLDQLRRLGVALVRRDDGAVEEPAAAGGEQDGEDGDRAERLRDLAATAAPSAPGYDALPVAR